MERIDISVGVEARKEGAGRRRWTWERKTRSGSCKDLPPRFRLKIKSYVPLRVGSRAKSHASSVRDRVEEILQPIGRTSINNVNDREQR